MKSIFGQQTVALFLFSLLIPLSGCGKESSPSPSIQKITTDQIVIIQTNPTGGGTGKGVVSGVSISPVSLPQPLFQSTAVTYTDSNSLQTFIYVIGGAYYDLTLSPDPINVNTIHKFLVNSNGSLSYLGVENSNLPNLRGHSSVIYNNSIYVIGGIGMGGFQKDIYQATIKMDTSNPPIPILNSWKWVGSLPVEETGQASVIAGDMMYVIGGVESGFPPPNCSPNCVGSQSTVFSNKIYGYDLLNFSTSSASNLTMSVPPFTMPKKLYTPAAIGLPNQVWVLGGWDGETNSNSNTAYLFNNISGGSLICSSVPNTCQNPLPLPYGGVSKAIGLLLGDSLLPKMVLLGGVSGNLNTPEVIRQEVYTSPVPSDGLPVWAPAPSLPKPVAYFSSASFGTVIYVFGGLLDRTS